MVLPTPSDCHFQIALFVIQPNDCHFQITVFRMSESSQDIDLAILTALLKGNDLQHTQNLMIRCIIEPSPVEMSQVGIMWST